jgi:hypothetical protein
MKRLRLPVITVLVLIAAAFAWWRFGTRHVPEGQPPLATLDTTTIAALRDDFNDATGRTRIIVLLAPT